MVLLEIRIGLTMQNEKTNVNGMLSKTNSNLNKANQMLRKSKQSDTKIMETHATQRRCKEKVNNVNKM